jgi:hypothetical protein
MKGTEKMGHPQQDKGTKTDPSNKPSTRPEPGSKSKTPKAPPFGDPQRNTPDKWQSEKTTNQPNRETDTNPGEDEQEEESTTIDQEEEEENPAT